MSEQYQKLDKASLIQLSDYIVENLPPLAIHQNDIYKYNGKHYEMMSDFEIGQAVYDFFKKHNQSVWTPTKAANIIAAIKYHPQIQHIKEFDTYKNLLNLNNTIIDISENPPKKIAHHESYFFTSIIDVDYDENNTEAPEFINVMNGIFRNNDGTVDKKTIINVLMLGGYLIYPQTKINMLFIFHGEGSNGKSIIMDDIYQMFFDEKFISALSLNTLSKESSFSRARLMTSRVNFATEQKADVIESEELKKITDGSNISIERKFKESITFKPKTKIIVACNKLPKFKDTTYGTKRRLFIVKFKNKFEVSKAKYEKIKKEGDPALRGIYLARNRDKMVADLKKEKSAIFNMFIDALHSLRNNNWQFLDTENKQEVLKEYNEESDPTGEWITDTFEFDNTYENFIILNDVYSQYSDWYDQNYNDRRFMVTKRSLAKRIRETFRNDGIIYSFRAPNGNVTSAPAFYIKHKTNECQELIDQLNPVQSSTSNLPEKTQESMFTQEEPNF